MRLVSTSFVLLLFSLIQLDCLVQANTSISYENPLVYVGADGNLYMTSLSSKTKTLLFASDEGEISGINWSPDGTKFVFVVGSYLYSENSGQKPVRLSDVEIDQSMTAWSPNGEKIAFFDERGNLQVVSVSNHEYQVFEKIAVWCIGDGPPPEPGLRLLDLETGQSSFRCAQNISWSDNGIVARSFGMASYSSKIIKMDGTIQDYKPSKLPYDSLSPNQNWEIRSYYKDYKETPDENSESFSTIDYYSLRERSSGKELHLPIPTLLVDTSGDFLWTSDSQSILYTTYQYRREVLNSLYKDGAHPSEKREVVWNKVFGYAPYSVKDSLIALNQYSLKTFKSTELFSRRGFAIGTIALAPDSSSAVLSFITSSVDAAKAIEEGKSAVIAKKYDISRVELIVLPLMGNNQLPYMLDFGGQPAFGKGSFNAISAR